MFTQNVSKTLALQHVCFEKEKLMPWHFVTATP